MASKTVFLNPNTYTKLDTTTDSAIDCQNVSTGLIRVKFSATEPTSGGYFVNPGQGVERNGHTGDMWALCVDRATAEVEVGE